MPTTRCCFPFCCLPLLSQSPSNSCLRSSNSATIVVQRLLSMASNGDASNEVQEVKEGDVSILQPKKVFYNKVQEFNRDFSILAINTFIKNQYWMSAKYNDHVEKRGISILDALSATGLRAVRYAKEVEAGNHSLKVHANDILPAAVEAIVNNAKRNNVEDKISVSHEDASTLMYLKRKFEDRFTIVDIDPYGSPCLFIDGAMQCIVDGGLLMVTCTDMAILCGNHSETCFAKYGSISLKMEACHEEALRIVLRLVDSCAARFGRYVVPLLSISADFYVRLFIQVFTGALQAKQSASKTGLVFRCKDCHMFSIQPLGIYSEEVKDKGGHPTYHNASGPVVGKTCESCGGSFSVGGPLWIHSIHSQDFVDKMIEELKANESRYTTAPRIKGMLHVISEELKDVALFRSLDGLCQRIKCHSPTMNDVRSAILNGGYRVSYSHTHKSSIKTDAPNSFIWDIMKKWINENPSQRKDKNDNTATLADRIIERDVVHGDISFAMHPNAVPESKKLILLRFQPNPERNWGPKPRPARKSGLKLSEGSDESTKKKFKVDQE